MKIIPPGEATHGNNPAILGIWHDPSASNAVIDSTVDTGEILILEVNATDAGNLRGFDITVRYDPLILRPLVATDVDYNGGDCLASSGCVFDGIGTLQFLKQVDSPTGQTRLAVTITDTLNPYAQGTGTIFRIAFTVQTSAGSSMINIVEGSSSLLNPGSVPYQGVDGYLDVRNTPEFNYRLGVTGAFPGVSSTTVTVNRPVSGTTTTTVPVHVDLLTGPTRTISLRVLGLPQGVTASFSASSGMPDFSSTLTLTITGGPAGGSSTTPSGTFGLAVSGNGTVVAGHFVRIAGIRLVVVPPPAPNFSLSASPTSATVPQGGWVLVTITGSLASGTPEPVSLSSNINTHVSGGATTFSPASPTLPFTVQMNISVLPATPIGPYKFNITGTSTGIYSEVSVVRQIVDYQLTVTKFDFQVESISLSRNFAYSGVTANPVVVTMQVKNNGTTTGTMVTIRAKANNSTHSITIGTTTTAIAPGATLEVSYNWNAHLLERGTYAVYGETSLANPANGGDFLSTGDMTVRLKGDVSNDCTVNVIDLALVGGSYGSPGALAADQNNDNTVNVIDLANVGGAFGQTCT